MNKLSKKFIFGIVLILLGSCVCSILLNTEYLEKFYLYEKRSQLRKICAQLETETGNGEDGEAAEKTEADGKVMTVRVEDAGEKDNEEINDEIRRAFQDKGIGFQKYWLWEEDGRKIANGEKLMRLYEQQNLNYSLLVEYMQIEGELYVVTMIIPNIADAFGIINRFVLGVNVACILLAILLIVILVRRITGPLAQIRVFAAKMEEQEFRPLKVHTGDELEMVADSLNTMGSRLTSYQESLRQKNEQMEHLLDNVAHDLKTPISLIKLYAEGMKDGLDDGTFLETIRTEGCRLEEMVERLLYVSRIGKKEEELTSVDLSRLLKELSEKYRTLAKEEGTELDCRLEEGIVLVSSGKLLESLFMNLITNALKYTAGRKVELSLEKKDCKTVFSIANETEGRELDLEKIWEPYYVGEKSRNKKLSGTGLGLVIVKTICEKLGYTVQCGMEGRKIRFTVSFPGEN